MYISNGMDEKFNVTYTCIIALFFFFYFLEFYSFGSYILLVLSVDFLTNVGLCVIILNIII